MVHEMPRAAVVCASLEGALLPVARAVEHGLHSCGINVDLVAAEHMPDVTDDIRLLVVGAPIHLFSLSGSSSRTRHPGLREWLVELDRVDPDGQHLAATFDTRVTRVRPARRAAGTRAAQLLRHRGFTLVTHPAAFLVHDGPGALATDELRRAERWGCAVALAALAHLEATGAPG